MPTVKHTWYLKQLNLRHTEKIKWQMVVLECEIYKMAFLQFPQ